MKPETAEDILELMNGSIFAAVLGTAMELGLFWLLADEPLPAPEIAQRLDIPLNRCHYCLQILCRLGLLEESGGCYAPSTTAREAILGVQSQETWAFQAREDRDLAQHVQDLVLNIGKPMPAGYSPAVEEDPIYTAGFTRKLYQIHRSLAEEIAALLDLQGINRMLDLGGGSGVVTFALLRKRPVLTSVVLDVESVCQVGRMICAENMLEDRVAYLAADFLKDDLPTGFDLAMLCDVGTFGEALFRRIRAILNPQGRLVIVDKFAPGKIGAPSSRLLAAFLASLESPAESVDYITTQGLQTQLQQAGFRELSTTPVPHKDNRPWNIDWTMVEAHK